MRSNWIWLPYTFVVLCLGVGVGLQSYVSNFEQRLSNYVSEEGSMLGQPGPEYPQRLGLAMANSAASAVGQGCLAMAAASAFFLWMRAMDQQSQRLSRESKERMEQVMAAVDLDVQAERMMGETEVTPETLAAIDRSSER